MSRKQLFDKYPYIVAWGKMMGSFGYYIEEECQKANDANISTDVLYYSTTKNRWILLEEQTDNRKAELEEYRNGTKGGLIVN